MAVVKCKGSFLKLSISASLTAIPNLLSFDHSGAESEFFDSTALDTSGAYRTSAVTGYSKPGTVSAEFFYDPANTTHQAVTDLITTPASSTWQIGFVDSGNSTQDLSVSGVKFGSTVAMDDGLKASIELQLSGTPDFTT